MTALRLDAQQHAADSIASLVEWATAAATEADPRQREIACAHLEDLRTVVTAHLARAWTNTDPEGKPDYPHEPFQRALFLRAKQYGRTGQRMAMWVTLDNLRANPMSPALEAEVRAWERKIDAADEPQAA